MLRKFFSIVICLISIVLLLAACQNEVPENAENDVPAENVNDGTLYTPEYAYMPLLINSIKIKKYQKSFYKYLF